MGESDMMGKVGIKIERPTPEKINPLFFVLLLASLILIGFMIWLLVLEWLGQPLPSFLRPSLG